MDYLDLKDNGDSDFYRNTHDYFFISNQIIKTEVHTKKLAERGIDTNSQETFC